MLKSIHGQSLFVLAAVCILLSGCGGDTHESIINVELGYMEDLVVIIEGVTDIESAKAAEAKVKNLADKMKALKARAEQLPDPSEEKEKVLEKMVADKQKSLDDRMKAAMTRLAANPPVMVELGKAMQAMGDIN